MNSQQKLIEESMLAQRGYLEIIRSRHHQWAYSTDDPEIRRLHLEIADSIQETMNRYYDILNTYRSVDELLPQERSDIFTFYPATISASQDA
jgi:hypothetical protein